MHRLLVFLFIFNLSPRANAQGSQSYLFTNTTAKEGLSSNYVNSMVQDEQGYLWLATLNGLQRYDGNRFITYKYNAADSNSIPDNHVSWTYIDKKKRLWLLFSNGQIGRFDTRRFTYTKAYLDIPSPFLLPAEKQLLEDDEGNIILLFRQNMLTTYNEQKNEFSSRYNVIESPDRWKILELSYDAVQKIYWMGCDSGMAAFNLSKKTLSYYGHNTDHLAVIDSFGMVKNSYAHFLDSQNRLWFISWPAQASYIYCFDNSSNKVILPGVSIDQLYNYYHEPRHFFQNQAGTVYLYGTGMLGAYDSARKTFVNVATDKGLLKTISNTRIDCLFEDREQNLWFTTHSNGIYQFNPSAQLFKSFPHINSITGEEGKGGLMSFFEERDRSVLYSAWGEGLYRVDSNYNHIPLGIKGLPDKNGITGWDICQRKDGMVWIGQQYGKITLYDPVARAAKEYTPSIIGGSTIRQLAEDHEGNMWLGTQRQGIFKWNPVKGAINFDEGFSHLDVIPRTLVEKLLVDSQGYLWICSMADGVYKINPATNHIVEHYTNRMSSGKGLLGIGVGDAFQYDDTTMIFAAAGLNILNTKTKTFTYLTSSDGLPSGIINAIEKDRNGQLWVSFLIGICRMNLQQKTFSFYDRSDGITNDVFSLAASLPLSNGDFIFGTTSDFTVFNPQNFTTRSVPPDVSITGFTLSNRELLMDSLLSKPAIRLGYNENSIAVYFNALSYLQKNKLTYFYKLDGIDKDWIKSSPNLAAVYSHLAPGDYTFHVKCQNADGISSEHITTMNIVVSQPFWRAWWFYGLLILGSASLIFWLDRERVRRKVAVQKMRSDIAGNLHEEISIALNNINILSELARLKTDEDPQKSKEYIEQIHTKSNNMIVAMDDMLWSLSPENDSMKKTIERMREYIDELRHQHNVSIAMAVENNVEALELNMKLRHESLLLFKEGIKSLVNSGMDKCEIQVRLEKNNLFFAIQFNNANCDMQQVYNLLHRADMEKNLKSINASLDVEVHKTNSTLILHIPVAS